MPLLKDLIDIPERVQRGDFVLKLSEGVERAEETLRQYVVTPQLEVCFDGALAFIRSGLDGHSSKASYLHGSFGSGKSHFMAVLHLLLQHSPAARSIPELAKVVAKHGPWLEGKKFLLVPYHMIGAHSMESAILGGYASHVLHLHPDAPVPGVYLADALFDDAERMRHAMGDGPFFERLNGTRPAGGAGWGALAARWDAATFGEAMRAPAKSEARSRLVGDLVQSFFSAYQGVARASDEAYVSLDEGLSIISRHARDLGYDALVLFLDELILWLASHAAELAFVNREGTKLSKLVEAQSADRPVPVISFVARQRDLRELVGEHVAGAEHLAFADVLRHWEARFNLITLEDRNLPAIVEKRVLRPKDEGARAQIDAAFQETAKVRQEVLETLLTTEADRSIFRKVYPFSPALVQALVAVSSVLQRERTALKVMLQLLVDKRNELELGQLIPVGDLYDVIAEGDEAFSDGMRRYFEDAKKLYYQKLLPMLENQHGTTWGAVLEGGGADGKAQALRNDARLLKTLLLAALVPEVEAFKGLTAARLAALNHGTLRSPIPGREGQMVLTKCRQWAAQVGEIKVGEGQNPTLSIQVTGVDTQAILDNAAVNNNAANRQRKVKELLFEQLGVESEDALFTTHGFTWRGTRRSCEVLFSNVRELPNESLKNDGDDWKVVFDFPFDAEGHTPLDDLARVEKFRQQVPAAHTVVWLPSFFSLETQRDLGTLVVLDHVLTGDRFREYATHLSAVDAASARSLLENRRSQLRQRIITCLEAAYAVATPGPGMVDTAHFAGPSDHFVSLSPTLALQPPVGANLRQALSHLLDQVMTSQYPAHPLFEAEIRTSALRKVLEEMRRGIQGSDGRIAIEQPLRRLMSQIAQPLRLGTMHETHFVADHHWKTHFTKAASQEAGALTVGRLRRSIDLPQPMGLPSEVESLLILLFAEATSRAFFLHGGAIEPSLEQMRDELELREERLPERHVWEAASRRAASILGVAVSPLLNVANLSHLASEAQRVARENREACSRLVSALGPRLRSLGAEPEASARFKTASATSILVEQVLQAAEGGIADTLATAQVQTSEEAMGSSLKRASVVCTELDASWDVVEAVGQLVDARKARAEALRATLREALEHDEYAVAIGPKLKEFRAQGMRLLSETAPHPEPPAAAVVPPSQQPVPGNKVDAQGQRERLSPSEANKVLDEIRGRLRPGVRVDITWKITREK